MGLFFMCVQQSSPAAPRARGLRPKGVQVTSQQEEELAS